MRLGVVKGKAATIRAAINAKEGCLRVLQYTAQMLGELRTVTLTPQKYFEVYKKALDEMQHVAAFFQDEAAAGRLEIDQLRAAALSTEGMMPRLMLRITLASVAVKTKAVPAKDVLVDLLEMAKGVPHPTHGLFVRHYLVTTMKDRLPDRGNEYDGAGGTVTDSVS